MTAALMLQGTGSDVGKSLIAAGLCRAYTARGLKVLPFKPQNMSNNAAVTADGGEIGRAQALQALACRAAPSVHMNPVLLKPETDTGAQVIVRGKRRATLSARAYMAERRSLLADVLDSFARLEAAADLIVVEGAGSPAEINLREGDIANMGFALAADVPVALVGDIHRGGLIASIIGTLQVISADDAARIKALLINNFHGDPALFADGVAYLSQHTGLPYAGVVPHFADARKLPAEDALALERVAGATDGDVRIAVPRLSRIANFDDLDPLRLAGARVEFVQPGSPIPANADLILLPGSKATIADLAFLRAQGWDIDILAHARRGGRVLGLCGGYQMLGRMVHDPDGHEGKPGGAPGLGLLDIESTLDGDKRLTNVSAIHVASGEPLAGYEIHLGRSDGPDRARPFAMVAGAAEGARSPDGRIEGSYLHGIFASDGFRRAYLAGLGGAPDAMDYGGEVDRTLDALAAHLEAHANLDLLLEIAQGRNVQRAGRVTGVA